MVDAELEQEHAECIYDEMRKTSPSALRAEALEGVDDLDQVPPGLVQAMTSAAMVCGVS